MNSFSRYIDEISIDNNSYKVISLKELSKEYPLIDQMPLSLRIILESLVRNFDGNAIDDYSIKNLLSWRSKEEFEIPLRINRVLMQDFTGVPALVDLALIRDYVSRQGLDPKIVNPSIPVDLVIDHSVDVYYYKEDNALEMNHKIEIEMNKDRYKFLKWAGSAFSNIRIFPPSAGICHQINLELLSQVVYIDKRSDANYLAPEIIVGTDSHTTMVNALGIIGFGVGGIEAEAALLNEPVYINKPRFIGVNLRGRLNEGVTATDFALTLTRVLRDFNVVNCFVEFFGEGLRSLSLASRATLSNMCPEYGATIALFPVDQITLDYLYLTGRDKEIIDRVREYMRYQGLFNPDLSKALYDAVIDFDLSTIEPSISGPSLPKQQIPLSRSKDSFLAYIKQSYNQNIEQKDESRWNNESVKADANKIYNIKDIHVDGKESFEVKDGDIAIAAITSCTNTSNTELMIAAGILAKKAIEKGLKVKNVFTKTSFAPGSRVVYRYLNDSGLYKFLKELGFNLVAYGCTTCIGNSGPLYDSLSSYVKKENLKLVAVLSGNRNYESRINNDVAANYLMSPPLVIAYAIAGSILKDLSREPLGYDKEGNPVYLKDIWPTKEEIDSIVNKYVSRDLYVDTYRSILDLNEDWHSLSSESSLLYKFDESNTYISEPPFLDIDNSMPLKSLYTLAVFGDSISTDHISPAGEIDPESPAGKYLMSLGVEKDKLNTYGSRRGNHNVMVRGTFANKKLRNLLIDKQGGYTILFPDNKLMSIYDAAMEYKIRGHGLVVFAGSEYGSGSSRDWAAKGPALLGVRAVVAKSFERIHRSNLVEMGVMPLRFTNGYDYNKLELDPSYPLDIELPDGISINGRALLSYTDKHGNNRKIELIIELRNKVEVDYYKAGGIMRYVYNKIISK
ncbi:MAG: aconitate hydratase [Candidatus Micrarchaeota archaeon]|nr:MAG: aconitate hydratase [Candidatus Micrarchaeota archaeon]